MDCVREWSGDWSLEWVGGWMNGWMDGIITSLTNKYNVNRFSLMKML